MSILDSLGALVQRHGGPEAVLGQVLNQMGGVDGVLDRLQQAGFGAKVQSWLGNDPNRPITPEQIGHALGHSKLGEVAARLGVPPDQLSELVAQALPGLIDKISPHGTPQPNLVPGAGQAPTS